MRHGLFTVFEMNNGSKEYLESFNNLMEAERFARQIEMSGTHVHIEAGDGGRL